jgi:hypothetical protein
VFDRRIAGAASGQAQSGRRSCVRPAATSRPPIPARDAVFAPHLFLSTLPFSIRSLPFSSVPCELLGGGDGGGHFLPTILGACFEKQLSLIFNCFTAVGACERHGVNISLPLIMTSLCEYFSALDQDVTV